MNGPARVVVVMGVAGAGKSTLGSALSDALGWSFIEGDDFHPEANRAKMQSGVALTDDDRWGWLDALNAACLGPVSQGRSVVVACSALRRVYRERLVRGFEGLAWLVYLDVTEEEASRRVAARDHFMPASLVPSQFEALQPPSADERMLRVDAGDSPRTQVLRACTWLGFPHV